MTDTGKIAGLVLTKNPTPTAYSLDSQIPNQAFGLYANQSDPYKWNTNGSNLLIKNFGFPIFEINGFDNDESTAALEMVDNYSKGIEIQQRFWILE